MNCSNCNRELQPHQKFCPYCGTKVVQVNLEVDKTVAADAEVIPEKAPAAEKTAATSSPWSQPASVNWKTGEPESYAAQRQEAKNNYQEQFNRYQQHTDYGQNNVPGYGQGYPQDYGQSYGQSYGQEYGQQTATTMKKGLNPKILIVIIAAAVIVIGGVVAGIFLFKGCTGGVTYKEAVADIVTMMNAGKYEEMMQKYSIDGKANLTESEKQKLALMQGIRYTADVDEANSKVYQKGSAEFERLLPTFTTDAAKQSQITEIAEVKATVTAKGNMLGRNIDQTSNSTLCMARVNGEWKLPGNISISPVS